MKTVPLGSLITPANPVRAGEDEYPILSITMHEGLVFQKERFKKAIAGKDLSSYKVVNRGQLVVGFPIDEGVLDFQGITDVGIVSPAYGVWDVIDQEAVDSDYLGRYLRSPQAISYYKLRLRGTTARRRSLTRGAFEALSVPLPHISEQQRIVEILNTSEEILQKEANLQDEILPLVINLVDRKVTSHSGTLNDLIESMSSGKNVAESTDPNQENRVLKVSAVTSGTFKPEESKPLPDTYAPPAEHQVRRGDVLVSRANTSQLLGASALVTNNVEDLYLPDKVWRVIPKEGVDPYLLWGILQTRTVRARISQRATGSSGSMKNISQKNFLQVPCATFTESESAELTVLIREAVSLHHQVGEKLALLRSLHDSLSTRAFAGKI